MEPTPPWWDMPNFWLAVAVMLFWVFPSMAFMSYKLRKFEIVTGWGMRSFFWLLEHTWPYSIFARFGRAVAMLDEQQAERKRAERCPVCARLGQHGDGWPSAEHALRHFPGEDLAWETAWWTPPAGMTVEQAEEWLRSRQVDLVDAD